MMGIDSAFLKGEVASRDRVFTLEAKLFRGRGRQLFSNGVRLKTAGELAGILTTVLFCPEDLYLIREGSSARRRFLDGAICQLAPDTVRHWQNITAFMTTRPAFCETGRRTHLCFRPWMTLICA